MKLEYEYASMPLAEVMSLASAVYGLIRHPDSYLSEDSSVAFYRDLLAQGFRWVRTEEGQAVFERIKAVYKLRTEDGKTVEKFRTYFPGVT